jgi:hypothetical protein
VHEDPVPACGRWKSHYHLQQPLSNPTLPRSHLSSSRDALYLGSVIYSILLRSTSLFDTMELNEEEGLVEYVNRSLDEEEDFHFLRFEFLQRVNIVRLELDLVRLKSRFQHDNRASIGDLDTLQSKLQDYGKKPTN